MGKEEQAELQFSEETESALIDFLYIDNERVDSFISQFRKGTLRSITQTIGTSSSSTMSGNADVKVLKCGIVEENSDNESTANSYDPYHSQIIQLMNDLHLPIANKLPLICSGRLICLESHIKIRDMHSVKALIPVVLNNKQFLNLQNTPDALATIQNDSNC